MAYRKIALVLAGTNPHIELIKNLKRRGYDTVLIDHFTNPPARRFADEHIRESTLDQEKVLEIANKMNASLVISACMDQANLTACYVAEKLGLPAPYSYETALNVTNKVLMKRIMLENNIPTSKFITADNQSPINISKLQYPVVVKPADSNGSKGVRKASNDIELKKYLKDALAISRSKAAIVEEFNKGSEVQIDCFVKNQKAHVVMIRNKYTIIDHGKSVIQSYGSLTPANISQNTKNYIQLIANKIVNSFNLDNTSLLIQATINGDTVKVIEFAPRVGGGTSYRLIKLSTGFDILNATIDSYLNLSVELLFSHTGFHYSSNNIYALSGIFGFITGFHDLIEDKIIEEFYVYKTKGMSIGSDLASRDRIGAYIVKGNSKKEISEKIKIATDRLEVYDINGKPIMRKDIYLKADKY